VNSYHFTGTISALFFLLALLGLAAQIQKLLQRTALKRAGLLNEPVTAILTLNRFISAFLAYYSFFLYGFLIEQFNPYLVWPRLAASFLVVWVLVMIWRDRRESRSAFVAGTCSLALVVGIALLGGGVRFSVEGQLIAKILVVAASALIVQSAVHQIVVIRRSGATGAMSLAMELLVFLKDISTIAFGFVMGLATGWPLLLLCGSSALSKIVVLTHFWWARRKSGVNSKC
jgi:hypothetical protein